MRPPRQRIIQAEVLATLATLPDGWADVLIADAPYSSGGLFRSDRSRSTKRKYLNHAVNAPADYAGDNRDGRSFGYWLALWLAEAVRATKSGAYIFMFSDWRQLPTTSDALQAGGFIWRGVAPWDKGAGSRSPHTGYFRHQCEYVLWGTNGPCHAAPGRGPFPGVIRCPVDRVKHHQAGKPVEVYRDLLRVCPDGGAVLDLFAGSGPAGVAAAERDLQYIGVERDAAFAAVATERIRQAEPPRLHGTTITTWDGKPCPVVRVVSPPNPPGPRSRTPSGSRSKATAAPTPPLAARPGSSPT